MGISIVEASRALEVPSVPLLPQDFLNCYEILNPLALSWPVTLYAVDSLNGSPQTHGQRGSIKDIIWKLLLGEYRHVRRGPGFVVDVSPRLVALPRAWALPAPISADGFTISVERSFVAAPGDSGSGAVVEGIHTARRNQEPFQES
jgi:hypothetical protein